MLGFLSCGTEPSITRFEMFDISVWYKHFFHGDMISLEAAPEDKINLNKYLAWIPKRAK